MKKLLMLAAAVVAIATAQAAQAQTKTYNLTLCAASVGGTWSLIGAGIDAAMKKAYPGSVVTIQTSPGGIANAALLEAHNCDLAIMHSPEISMALQGKPPFREPLSDIKLLARIESWSPLHIMVAKSFADKYKLETTADLAKAKAPVRAILQKTGNIGYAVSSDVLDKSGASIENIQSWGGGLLHGASSEQADMMHDRRADLAMNVLFPGAAQVLDVNQGVPITLLSIPDDVIETISKDWSVPAYTIPKGTYDFVDHDIKTVTLGAHLVALDSTPDDVVTAILTAITDHSDQIASVHPSMKQLDVKQYPKSPLPYHAAAVAFYKSRNMASSD